MKEVKKALLLLAGMLLIGSTSLAATNATEETEFYKERETGWYWRKDDTQKKQKEKKQKPEIKKKKETFKPKKQERKPIINKEAELLLSLPENITEKDLEQLTPKQIGKLYDLYYRRLLWQPNQKDMENVIKIQNFITKRATTIAVAMSNYAKENPHLDPYPNISPYTFARRQEEQAERKEMYKYLEKWKNRAGLFFVFESTCKFCQAEANILKIFQQRHGWEILAISADGKCLPQFPQCRFGADFVQKFNIKYFPTIYLVIPNYNGKKIMQIVGYGAMSLDTLRQRIYEILYTIENGHPPRYFRSKKEWDFVNRKELQVKNPPILPEKFRKVFSENATSERESNLIDERFNSAFWGK